MAGYVGDTNIDGKCVGRGSTTYAHVEVVVVIEMVEEVMASLHSNKKDTPYD